MCNPAMVVMGTMMLAGGAAQHQAAGQQASASRRAISAERERQDQYRNQAQQRFTEALGTFDNAGQAREDVAASRTEALQGNISSDETALSAAPVSGSAPSVVQSEIAKKVGEALAAGRENAALVARRGAFGQNMFDNSLQLGRSRQDLNTIGNFALGSANTLPGLLQNAQNKGAGLRTFGDILSSVGSVGMFPAANGSFGDLFSPPVVNPTVDPAGRILGGI